MTPILIGRWQTRTFMTLLIGIPITLLFGLAIGDLIAPFVILSVAYLQGMLFDIIYNLIQKRRWEKDWSPLLFTASGLFEAVILLLLIRIGSLPMVSPTLPFHLFVIHYTAVWLGMFIIAWGGMKVLFPWWRFRGGSVLGR